MLHREKLRNMRDEPRPVLDQRFCELTDASHKNHFVAVEYLEKEKAHAIRRENEALLSKLLEIAEGRQLSVGKHTVRQPKGPRSLNYGVKKAQAERIDQENEQLMVKILTLESTLSRKKMQKDWVKSKSYKKILQKNRDIDLVRGREAFLQKNYSHLPSVVKQQRTSQSKDATDRTHYYGLANRSRYLGDDA